MRPLATGNAFFTSSGSSPPDDDARVSDQEAGPIEGHPLPPQLIEDLAALLASALIADIRQHPNLAPIQANQDSTVESPWGLNRSRTSPHGDVPNGPARSALSAAYLEPPPPAYPPKISPVSSVGSHPTAETIFPKFRGRL